MRKNKNYWIRKSHRYLGLFIGIQFIFWTIGGLYFSWNDIDEIHGDHLRSQTPYLSINSEIMPIQSILDSVRSKPDFQQLMDFKIIQVNGTPYYQIKYINQKNETRFQLVDCESGAFKPEIHKAEAIEIANSHLKINSSIESVEYITQVNDHHEYRGKPLPAWAVTYQNNETPTFYIASTLGTLQAVRHNRWRIFDFLWMMHTMDYESRDDFGNILLKAFSILGLVTIFSGFLLYFYSSPTVRKLKRKLNFKTK